MNLMINLAEELKEVRTVGIAGHIRPDGDSIGSCLGLYLYLKENYPETDCTVYLEQIPDAFCQMKGTEEITHVIDEEKQFDLFFSIDCAGADRLGDARTYLNHAKKTICIDHHISNKGFADINYIVPEASSASELVYGILEPEKIPTDSAAALYMGIVHDTGVFRHSCTAPETMEIAAGLMRRGIDATKIINSTYYDKTYYQNQILGKALLESTRLMDGKVIYTAIYQSDMEFYGVTSADLDGIVQILMGTVGAEAAVFLYELKPQTFKVSMRSKEFLDVSRIASEFGGGGHVRAAGCNMQGPVHEIINKLLPHMEAQFAER